MLKYVNKCKLLILLLTFVLLTNSAKELYGAENSAISMNIGDSTVIRVPNSGQVTVSNPNVVSLHPEDNYNVKISAIQVGETFLSWMDTSGNMKAIKIMVQPQLTGMAADIAKLLTGIPNVNVSYIGDKIVIDGKLISMQDVDRVAKIVQAYPNVLNLTTFDRGPSNEIVEEFIHKISGINTIKVKVIGQTAYISGYVFDETARSNVLLLAKTQVPNVVDMIKVHDIMIETEVIFVKITKSGGYDLGMNMLDGGANAIDIKLGGSGSYNRNTGRDNNSSWGSQWTMPISPTYGPLTENEQGGQTIVNKSSHASAFGLQWSATLLPKLNALVNNGDASILARPRLGTKNGEAGKFISGGEFYYQVSGVQAADMKNIVYGFQLSVKPELVTEDKIMNTISMDISIPTSKSGSEDLNLDKFQVQNTLVCQLGQSIVISGFLQNIRNYMRSRTPVLGDIPIIGLLFSKRVRADEDQDIIVIVTPRILNYTSYDNAISSASTNIQLKLKEHNLDK